MKKCTINKVAYYPPQVSLPQGKREVLPPEEAIFHGFTTETNDDMQLVTMAIVEYSTGIVETIPLAWLVLHPVPAENTPAEAMHYVVDDLLYRLREVLTEAASSFRR